MFEGFHLLRQREAQKHVKALESIFSSMRTVLHSPLASAWSLRSIERMKLRLQWIWHGESPEINGNSCSLEKSELRLQFSVAIKQIYRCTQHLSHSPFFSRSYDSPYSHLYVCRMLSWYVDLMFKVLRSDNIEGVVRSWRRWLCGWYWINELAKLTFHFSYRHNSYTFLLRTLKSEFSRKILNSHRFTFFFQQNVWMFLSFRPRTFTLIKMKLP